MQTIMHLWYQLGNIYSSQCKDQTEFMTKLKELSKETGFKEPDELTKFLFVIHNTDSKVREYLIDKGDYTERSVQVVKGFMKRSVEWPICLLEYLITPIRYQGVDNSPLKLMQKRTIRGLLPVKQQESNLDDYERNHARKDEQTKYQTGKPLQELPEGSNILFYSERESQWLPGVIVQRLHDRSYVIISEKGRKVVRNRIDIKRCLCKIPIII